MTIAFSCPACRKKIEVPGELAGRKAKCKGCGGPLLIPTPRIAPQAELAAVETDVEDPYDFEEADTFEDSQGLDGVVAPIPPRVAVPRSKQVARPSRPARSKTPGQLLWGVEAVSSIVFCALGIVAIVAGLMLIELFTYATVNRGFGPKPGYRQGYFLIVFLLPLFLLGVGVTGFLKVYRLFNPRVSEESFRNLVGGAVMFLALVVIGVRCSRGGEPLPLAEKLLFANWDWVGGARPQVDAAGNDHERDHSAPKIASPERAALVRKMIAEARSDDSSLQEHGLNVLCMLVPDVAEAAEVRTCLRSLLATSTGHTLVLVVNALAGWGNAEDIPAMEARQYDPDLSLRTAVISCLDNLRRQPK